MTNIPSREELEAAIHVYSNAVSDDIDSAWLKVTELLDILLDELHSSPIEPMTLEQAVILTSIPEWGMLTVNEARTNILGWPPLPPDDHRGNTLLRRDSND